MTPLARHALRVLAGVTVGVLIGAGPTAQVPETDVRPSLADSLEQLPASQPQFRGGTTLVPVDVRVVDRDGKPVTDLTAADFAILEDGIPQKIGHFSTHRFQPEAVVPSDASRPSRASDAFDTSSPNSRTFLILLGRGHLQEPSKGVDAMQHLVRERLLPQDYVAVMAWNRATDFTRDRDQIASVIERFRAEHVGIEIAYRQWSTSLARVYGDGRIPARLQERIDKVFGGARASNVRTMETADPEVRHEDEALRRIGIGMLGPGGLGPVDSYMADRHGSFDAFLERGSQSVDDLKSLYMAIEHMRHIAGQKQIVFVSEYGFSMPEVDRVRLIGRRASDARVVMNFIHAGGVYLDGLMQASSRSAPALVPVGLASREMRNIETGMDARTITRLSGGLFYAHRFGQSKGDVDAIEDASRFLYALGYYPLKDPTDGRYRRIEVKALRPNLRVLARDGYYARAQVGPLETRSAMIFGRVANVAERSFLVSDIALSSVASKPETSGPARELPVGVTIDLSRVAFSRQGSQNVASIDIAVFAVTSRQKDAGHIWQSVNLNYNDDRLAEIRKSGLRHEVMVPLVARADEFKVVVYDYGSDLAGSAVGKVAR